ncbi:MAG: response regulator [Desulfosarcinaceae bacterium]|nr:response regulator [Desulfosarcinaceae bacterium]
MKTSRADNRSSQASDDKGKVLVIEDNPKNRKLIKRLLEIHGFEVLEAEDAETGIQLAGDCHPDLILMDIQLPGMDGLEATKIIKNTPAISQINIIALTSYAMQGDSDKAKSAGCDGYITKPINTREFVGQIKGFIGKKEATQPPAKEGHSKDPKILIVDDEPMNLKLLQGKLKKEYDCILTAADGFEALQIANEDAPDIILLDIMMPEIDGFEVTRKLKAAPNTKDIPIILVTALDGHDYKVLGYEAGADEFLNKPINTVELLTRMRSLLDMKKCQDKLVADASKHTDSQGLELVDSFLNFQDGRIQLMMSDSDHCQSVQLYLFQQACDISITNELESATAAILHHSPDILIIDHQLHEAAYLEFCEHLKSDERTGNCQILYAATEQDLEKQFSKIEHCIDDFLTLPINVHELRARIGVLLKKKAFLDRLYEGQSNNIQAIITDQLTGLYNFDYCKHVLKHELHRASREHTSVAFVLMEVSDYLCSNNALGHLAGDPLFRDLSELIQRSIRKLDIASRRSKQTYAFVLPEADTEKTKGFIQRMKGLFMSQLTAVKVSGKSADELFFFGFAICPEDSDLLEALIEKAESELLANRRTGSDANVEMAALQTPVDGIGD